MKLTAGRQLRLVKLLLVAHLANNRADDVSLLRVRMPGLSGLRGEWLLIEAFQDKHGRRHALADGIKGRRNKQNANATRNPTPTKPDGDQRKPPSPRFLNPGPSSFWPGIEKRHANRSQKQPR